DYLAGKIKRAANRPKQSRVARKRGLAGLFLSIALKDPGRSTDELADELRKKFKQFGIGLEGLSSTVLREMIARLRKLPEPLSPTAIEIAALDEKRELHDGIISPPSRTPEQLLARAREALEDGIKTAEHSGN